MNIAGLNSGQDINTLKKLLAQGLISEDDLSGAAMSGSFGPVQGAQNALTDLVNPGPQDGSQAPQPSSADLAAQGQQFVRNESTGQTMYMGPNGPSDIPYAKQLQGQVPQAPQTQVPNPSAAYTGPRMMPQGGQGQMRVVGSGQGQVTDLGTEPAKAVPLDYSRPQIDVPGVGRGYYGRDGNAYVPGPDGSMTKVLLGYDAQGSAALTNQKLAQQKTIADIAHTQESIRASRIQNPDFSSMGVGGADGPQMPLQGLPGATSGNAKTAIGPDGLPQTPKNDAFLQTLDPQIAAQVKAYADGRLPIPAGFALKSPYFQNMLRLVGQYDPSFDFVNANARAATRKSFSAGPDAANVAALNTAIYHLGSLKDAFDALDNTRFPTYNAVANTVGEELGNAGVQQGVAGVNAKAQAVAEELAKVFRAQGMSESEVNAWKSKINTNSSPATSNETIKSALDLMDGRLQALADKYNAGMGTTADPVQLLKPKAAAVLEQLRGQVSGAPQAPAVASSDPLVVIAPDGSRHRFPTPQQATAFRQAIAQ